jgi:CRISPR-associated protein Cmr2
MKTIALTIGPIIKTLSGAKKTQELWASSYLFSYIMKEIIREFEDREFIVPYVDADLTETVHEVGLFHDRFIFYSQEGDIERLESRIQSVVDQVARDLGLETEYLRRYLQIHYGEYDLVDKDQNPILSTTPYMDAAELNYRVSMDGEDHLRVALREKQNHFKKLVFGDDRAFASLPEIALADRMDKELRQEILSASDELDIYDTEHVEHVEHYHKYIAIVQADGDNMGKVVSSLKHGEYTAFSQKLFEYCTESAELIREYKGATIFAGGDDLLFFAPVANRLAQKNIFDLLDEISNLFDAKFKDYNETLQAQGEPKATLSFGVSITYYKFPLYEALEQSRNLLIDEAKTGDKNNIAYKVIKHSGQSFGGIIHKGDAVIYPLFLSVIGSMSDRENADKLLHSLHHKLHAYRVLVKEAARHEDDSMIANFFTNFFKKDVHKNFDLFFAAMTKYIHAVYQTTATDDEKKKIINGTLRFVKFLQGDKS